MLLWPPRRHLPVRLVVMLPVLVLLNALVDAVHPMIVGGGVFGLFLTVIVMAAKQNRPPRLGQFPPLSRDDLEAARSKLRKDRYRPCGKY